MKSFKAVSLLILSVLLLGNEKPAFSDVAEDAESVSALPPTFWNGLKTFIEDHKSQYTSRGWDFKKFDEIHVKHLSKNDARILLLNLGKRLSSEIEAFIEDTDLPVKKAEDYVTRALYMDDFQELRIHFKQSYILGLFAFSKHVLDSVPAGNLNTEEENILYKEFVNGLVFSSRLTLRQIAEWLQVFLKDDKEQDIRQLNACEKVLLTLKGDRALLGEKLVEANFNFFAPESSKVVKFEQGKEEVHFFARGERLSSERSSQPKKTLKPGFRDVTYLDAYRSRKGK